MNNIKKSSFKTFDEKDDSENDGGNFMKKVSSLSIVII